MLTVEEDRSARNTDRPSTALTQETAQLKQKVTRQKRTGEGQVKQPPERKCIYCR